MFGSEFTEPGTRNLEPNTEPNDEPNPENEHPELNTNTRTENLEA